MQSQLTKICGSGSCMELRAWGLRGTQGLWAVAQGWNVLATWVWDCISAVASLGPAVNLCALWGSGRAAPPNAPPRAPGQGEVVRMVLGSDSTRFRYLQSRLLGVSCHAGLSRQQGEASGFIMPFICSVLSISFSKRWITVGSINNIDWLSLDSQGSHRWPAQVQISALLGWTCRELRARGVGLGCSEQLRLWHFSQ